MATQPAAHPALPPLPARRGGRSGARRELPGRPRLVTSVRRLMAGAPPASRRHDGPLDASSGPPSIAVAAAMAAARRQAAQR